MLSLSLLPYYSDSIEANIDTAVDNVESGKTNLQKAATYQVNTVPWQWKFVDTCNLYIIK